MSFILSILYFISYVLNKISLFAFNNNNDGYNPTKLLTRKFPLLHSMFAHKFYKRIEYKFRVTQHSYKNLNNNNEKEYVYQTLHFQKTNLKYANHLYIVLPGIYGNIDSLKYFLDNDEFNKKSCAVFVLLNSTFDCSDFSHLKLFISFCRTKFHNCRISAIGFSLGGTKLVNYLTYMGSRSLISNALLISVVLNARETHINLSKLKYQLTIDKYMTRNFNILHNSRYSCVLDIVNNFVLPKHGHKSLNEYFKKASVYTRFKKIKVPTTFLIARDDMFVPNLYDKQIKKNKLLTLIAPNSGGHAAFVNNDGSNYISEITSQFCRNAEHIIS